MTLRNYTDKCVWSSNPFIIIDKGNDDVGDYHTFKVWLH